jgi:prevent-host-death family protein
VARPVNLYDAKTHLSALVDRAAGGEEIVIAKSGRPLARLVPLTKAPRRRGGFLRGRIRIAPDFDAPLAPEILLGTGVRSR